MTAHTKSFARLNPMSHSYCLTQVHFKTVDWAISRCATCWMFQHAEKAVALYCDRCAL